MQPKPFSPSSPVYYLVREDQPESHRILSELQFDSIRRVGPNTWLMRAVGFRKPLDPQAVWRELLSESVASMAPIWKLAEPAPRPLKGSARQRIGLVRYLAGTRRWTPRPRRSVALPMVRTFALIKSPPSDGPEPSTRTAGVGLDAVIGDQLGYWDNDCQWVSRRSQP